MHKTYAKFDLQGEELKRLANLLQSRLSAFIIGCKVDIGWCNDASFALDCA